MTTARIVKLGAGEFLTMAVESATEVEGQYGKQAKFEGQTVESEDVVIFLPLDSANRQLERLSANLATIKGSIVKIEKVAKDGKTFININRVGAASKQAVVEDSEPEWMKGQGADETAFVQSTKEPHSKIFTHYDKCFEHANELAVPLIRKGVTVTLEGISAMAATLFIATKSSV
jgi:hypothetical protein